VDEMIHQQIVHTSDDMFIASAIISNPASIFKIFFTFSMPMSRLERDKATPAASCWPSLDAES
jgi:hypothetical protein